MKELIIKLESLNAVNNRLTCKLGYSDGVKKYFLTDKFFFAYEGININTVDESILVIPVLSIVMSIAWAVGAQVYINKIDESYLESLKRVENTFKHFYPQFSYMSKIHAGNIVSNTFSNHGTGLLFSGGIDLLTAYARHKGERPLRMGCRYSLSREEFLK